MADRPTGDQRRVAILISGRGSNMRALIEQSSGYEVVLVASNKPQAPGLDFARAAGIPTWARDSKAMPREEFEAALDRVLIDHRVGTVALAGFMRLLSPAFVERWRGRIVNMHPSLLPKYPGLDTHTRAITAGEQVSGCTVHLVNEELDAGQIIAASEVAIEPNDTPHTLASRILTAEHKLYPRALAQFVAWPRQER